MTKPTIWTISPAKTNVVVKKGNGLLQMQSSWRILWAIAICEECMIPMMLWSHEHMGTVFCAFSDVIFTDFLHKIARACTGSLQAN